MHLFIYLIEVDFSVKIQAILFLQLDIFDVKDVLVIVAIQYALKVTEI